VVLASIINFIRLNGVFIFICEALSSPQKQLRNILISRKLKTRNLMLGSRSYLRGLTHIEIGDNFHAGNDLWLEAVTRYGNRTFSPKIKLGDSIYISHWTHIAATNLVVIGDNVLIGSKVLITDHNHGHYGGPHSAPEMPPVLRPLNDNEQVIIGSNVWLGDGVVVLPGSSIGDGSVIGANSVVKGSIPPFTIAAGCPIRILKRYDFSRKEWIKYQ
jgi:lipopolysaccharide O-acetyltransferase